MGRAAPEKPVRVHMAGYLFRIEQAPLKQRIRSDGVEAAAA